MTAVYTHLSPFPKRAVAFFRQRRNEIGRRDQIGSELDGLLRKQEFFYEFLASHGSDLQPWERKYVRDQADEVAASLNAINAELAVLNGILKSLNLCPACNGHGEIRFATPMYGPDPDPSVVKCGGCDGDGVIKR